MTNGIYTHNKIVFLLRPILELKGTRVKSVIGSVSAGVSGLSGCFQCVLQNKPLPNLMALTVAVFSFSWVCPWSWVQVDISFAPWVAAGTRMLHGFCLSWDGWGILSLSLSFRVTFLVCCWASHSGLGTQPSAFQEDKHESSVLESCSLKSRWPKQVSAHAQSHCGRALHKEGMVTGRHGLLVAPKIILLY